MCELLRLIFGCPHERLGWPRRRNGVDVQVCVDCGHETRSQIQFAGSEAATAAPARADFRAAEG
jgi:hypothetical protein